MKGTGAKSTCVIAMDGELNGAKELEGRWRGETIDQSTVVENGTDK